MLSPGGMPGRRSPLDRLRVPARRPRLPHLPRASRRRAVGVLLVLALFAASGAAAWWWGIRPQPTASASTCTSPGKHAVPGKQRRVVPVGPAHVTVRVLNTTARPGLATTVAAELTARHFVVATVGNDSLKRTVHGVAEVRAGSRGRGAAATVMAQVADATLIIDKRKDTTVDLAVGDKYTTLQTAREANAAIRAVMSPSPEASPEATPSGDCA